MSSSYSPTAEFTDTTTVLADGAQLANANFNGTSRTFQFSQLAINNVSRIEVAKVPTPATPADSVSGSINMVSKSAFERSRAELRYRLYAAGNVMASAMGMTYGGAGGTLGPGMVFGFAAGRHAARLGLGSEPATT